MHGVLGCVSEWVRVSDCSRHLVNMCAHAHAQWHMLRAARAAQAPAVFENGHTIVRAHTPIHRGLHANAESQTAVSRAPPRGE